jgi:hypothetical protein
MANNQKSKSCHADQLSDFGPDLSQLSVSAIELGGDRVHKRVHKRVVRMADLTQQGQLQSAQASA